METNWAILVIGVIIDLAVDALFGVTIEAAPTCSGMPSIDDAATDVPVVER